MRALALSFLLPLSLVAQAAEGNSEGLVTGKVAKPPAATPAPDNSPKPAQSAMPALAPQQTPSRFSHPLRPGEKIVATTHEENWLQAGMDTLAEEKKDRAGKPDSQGQRAQGFLSGVAPIEGVSDADRRKSAYSLSDYTAVWTKDGAAAVRTDNVPRTRPDEPVSGEGRAVDRQFPTSSRRSNGGPTPLPNPYLADLDPGRPAGFEAPRRPEQVNSSSTRAAPAPSPVTQPPEPTTPLVNDRKYFPQMKRF